MKIAKSVNRLGTEAAYSIFAKTKKLEKQGKKIIDLSLGQSDFKSPRHVVDATIKALKDGHHGYTLPNGIIECREAVSRKIKSLYHATIDPERIIIMPGGKPTMHYAISFFGEPGAEIIYPDPGFPIYESMINYTGAKACSIGKGYLFALGAGVRNGIEFMLQKMKAEIKRDMTLMGCKSVKELNRSKIVFRKNYK